MCNIGVKHTKSMPIITTNSYVWTPNDTQLEARNLNIIIGFSHAANWFINDYFDLIIIGFLD